MRQGSISGSRGLPGSGLWQPLWPRQPGAIIIGGDERRHSEPLDTTTRSSRRPATDRSAMHSNRAQQVTQVGFELQCRPAGDDTQQVSVDLPPNVEHRTAIEHGN